MFNNLNIELWIIVGLLFGLFVLGLFFLMSMGDQKKRRRRAVKPANEKEQRDWKEAALRLEKHIAEVKKENMSWKKQVRILEREKDVYQKKCDDLAVKLDREKIWQQKESEGLEKKNLRIKSLEDELKQMGAQSEHEHLEFVAIKRKNIDLKQDVENKAQVVRQLNLEIEKNKAQMEVYRKEILQLRGENKKLSKKHEDVQWIAKSVHQKVKEELRQKVQELEKLRDQVSRA